MLFLKFERIAVDATRMLQLLLFLGLSRCYYHLLDMYVLKDLNIYIDMSDSLVWLKKEQTPSCLSYLYF